MNRAGVAGVGLLVVLTGCADRLVEVSTSRPAATVVTLDRSGRCPADTVLLDDDDPASGAGAIPGGFYGRTVLRCDIDYSTMSSRGGADRFTVRQWQDTLTPQLQAALALPDREFSRGGEACAASNAGTTAIYVVEGRDRAVRVLPPTEEPCQAIRGEVEALLPGHDSPADQTFAADRKSR